MGGRRSLICGVGINDSEDSCKVKINGKWYTEPIYVKWVNMIHRCYSKSDKYYPTYKEVSVSEEWLYYSNFRDWYLSNRPPSDSWHLDKELLGRQSEHYSPETCCMVSHQLNQAIVFRKSNTKAGLIGASWLSQKQKYQACVVNPETGKKEHLGFFVDPYEAHRVWRKRRREILCYYADTGYGIHFTDSRVPDALRNYYLDLEEYFDLQISRLKTTA